MTAGAPLPTALEIAETSYGIRKRFLYVAEALRRASARTVLDVGCGTGAQLTFPLAAHFPTVVVTGVDSDEASLAYARVHQPLPNLDYHLPPDLPIGRRFDVIVLSEVLEHVEDPVGFLATYVRERLEPNGIVVVTVPNGFGPSECAAMLLGVMRLTGVFAFVNGLRARRRVASTASANGQTDTLAASPHLNFFSLSNVERVFAAAGIRVVDYRARTFLCGFVFDGIVRIGSLAEWNARVADRLPAGMVSGWMFLAAPDGSAPRPMTMRQGWVSRLRRRVHRWMSLHPPAGS